MSDVPDDSIQVADPDGDDEDRGRLIRPYAITGGRTGGETEISLEAQIHATDRGMRQLTSYRWEAAKVVEHSSSSPHAPRSRSGWHACSSPT
jgi:hypothetical protein